MQQQDFFHSVSTTRSMRRLDTRPVPMEMIRTIIDAGTRAASGQNTQPWHFVVITETEGRSKLGGWYQEVFNEQFSAQLPAADDHSALARDLRAAQYLAEHLHEAPVLLLVCGLRDWPFDMKGERRVGPAPPSYGSVYPCVQNILLACRALGLGATITTAHRGFESRIHTEFGISDEYGVVAMIPIGYSLGKFGPVTRKSLEEVVSLERWGNLLPVA